MLNDVVKEIQSIDLTDKSPNQITKVIVELDYGVIYKLREEFGENVNDDLNFILNHYFQNKTKIESNKIPELTFKNRTKIRSDPLRKLKAISDLLRESSNYPIFRKNLVEYIIKQVLVEPDSRTLFVYVDCINQFQRKIGKLELSFYSTSDLSSFVQAVDNKISGIQQQTTSSSKRELK